MLFIDRVACLVEFSSYPVRRSTRVFGRALRRLHAEIDACEPAARLYDVRSLLKSTSRLAMW